MDDGGNLIAVHRMHDAWLASIDIAQNKAWTSAALKMPAATLAIATVPAAEVYQSTMGVLSFLAGESLLLLMVK